MLVFISCLKNSTIEHIILKVFSQVNMKELRKKSVLLTGYLELLLNQHLSSGNNHKLYVNKATSWPAG